ncbi:MAG: 50S ribosomal protein L30 [Rickettsiales bacterium]|nr:MAG: 50S ribosomal protein L30 [Rickettsiales bacterium]
MINPYNKNISVKQIASPIGRKQDQRQTLIALGLNKINRVKTIFCDDSVYGMISKIKHLVQIEDID